MTRKQGMTLDQLLENIGEGVEFTSPDSKTVVARDLAVMSTVPDLETTRFVYGVIKGEDEAYIMYADTSVRGTHEGREVYGTHFDELKPLPARDLLTYRPVGLPD